jgi:hypothetical protein
VTSDERVPGGSAVDREPDQGGDPVCWLDRVCPECGGFITDEGECRCPDGPTAAS